MGIVEGLLSITIILSLFMLLVSLLGTSGARTGKRCTAKTEGTLKRIIDETRSEMGVWFLMEYEVEGKIIENSIPQERVEDLTVKSREGDKAVVWYDPSKPTVAVVGKDRMQTETKAMWKKIRKFCIKLAVISSILLLIIMKFAG